MSPPPASRSVAVIDLGSNSIKVLVAAGGGGRVRALFSRTIDARISAGIGRRKSRLGPAGMARGLAAVRTLLKDAARYAPRSVELVATSAVRDAANGAEFLRRIRRATGRTVRLLSGREEADLIGRGLGCDPALSRRKNFYLFDLGGGSLECLAFRRGRTLQALSTPLGCVRLTEKFVPHPARPLAAAAVRSIAEHTRRTLEEAGFAFSLPAGTLAVGTGGTLTCVRAVRAERRGITFERTDPWIPLAELRELLARLGSLPLARRRKVAGLPPARADVFPAALATLVALAEAGGFPGFRHSLHNLRWGVAAEALERRSRPGRVRYPPASVRLTTRFA